MAHCPPSESPLNSITAPTNQPKNPELRWTTFCASLRVSFSLTNYPPLRSLNESPLTWSLCWSVHWPLSTFGEGKRGASSNKSLTNAPRGAQEDRLPHPSPWDEPTSSEPEIQPAPRPSKHFFFTHVQGERSLPPRYR